MGYSGIRRHVLMNYNYTVTSWELRFGCCLQLIYNSLKMLHSHWLSFPPIYLKLEALLLA